MPDDRFAILILEKDDNTLNFRLITERKAPGHGRDLTARHSYVCFKG